MESVGWELLWRWETICVTPVRKLPVKEFADRYDERFRTMKPLVGEMLPAVKAWDANGEEFDFAQARGKYTVLVFGCLT